MGTWHLWTLLAGSRTHGGVASASGSWGCFPQEPLPWEHGLTLGCMQISPCRLSSLGPNEAFTAFTDSLSKPLLRAHRYEALCLASRMRSW